MSRKQRNTEQKIDEGCANCVNNLGEKKPYLIKCKEYEYLVVASRPRCIMYPSKFEPNGNV